MKKKFFCDKCGEDFDDEKQCAEHEEKCPDTKLLNSRIRGLEKRVESLEEKIIELSHRIDLMKPAPFPYPVNPTPINPAPTQPIPGVPYIPPVPFPNVVLCKDENSQAIK